MEAIVDIRRSRAARLARHAAAFSALLFVVSALSHRYRLLDTPGFVAVLATTGALALLALLLALSGVRSVWRDGDTGARDIAFGVIVALIVLSPFGVAVWKGVTLPPTHDVSTDTDNPPALPVPDPPLAGVNAPAVFDAAMAERQRDGYPDVVGRRYPAAPDRVQAAVETLIANRRWVMLPARQRDGGPIAVEAEGATPVLGFPFAVAIRIGEEGDTTIVDMRSASRFGRYDFGDNARRITTFLTDLDAEVARQAGA